MIAIEGLDGAGKSTVISVLARRLRSAGCPVFLPRTGKEPSSTTARMIREITRDRRNLDLDDRTELALYCAREAQIIAEQVRPAVAAGAAVLLDRSLLTPIVLGAYGRGLPRPECEAVANGASGGLRADVTVVLDVHPRTSRIRKRLGRIRNPAPRDPSRKGLAGSGLKERVWAGYREIAAERDHLLFHTERIDPAQLAERVVIALTTGARPSDLESEDDAIPIWQLDADADFDTALDEVPEDLALYMTRGLIAGRDRRARAIDREPALVHWALDSEDPLLDRVLEAEAPRVLAGWTRRPLGDPADPRERLASRYPAAVARSLRHVHEPQADRMRLELLAELAPAEVVESLCGREDAFAVELRARLWSHASSSQATTSLIGCVGPAASRHRSELFERDPAIALRSLRGLDDDTSRARLIRYAPKAPKAVLRGLVGNGSPFAHALRRQLLPTGREVLDSLRGLDDPEAMQLREECVERWPSSVLGSLSSVAEGPRVHALIDRCRLHGAGDLHVLRQLAARDELDQRPAWERHASLDTDEGED